MKRQVFRIIDANLNRTREGLRVCEEITRFLLDEGTLTRDFKNIRHQVSLYTKKFPGGTKAFLRSRESEEDVGNRILNKSARKDHCDVFLANIQRVKESLRVLEEFSRIFSLALSGDFAKLRFKIYTLEKKVIARL